MNFIRNGGKAIYLNGAGNLKTIDKENAAFIYSAKVHPARGLWTCIPHLIRDHPIFNGLPSDTIMRDTYENVWPKTSIRDLEIEEGIVHKPIVASIGFDWFSRNHKMQYSGPGPSWWGYDLFKIEYGKGELIHSQFRIIENLGKDPVADKLLLNIINYFNE